MGEQRVIADIVAGQRHGIHRIDTFGVKVNKTALRYVFLTVRKRFVWTFVSDLFTLKLKAHCRTREAEIRVGLTMQFYTSVSDKSTRRFHSVSTGTVKILGNKKSANTGMC